MSEIATLHAPFAAWLRMSGIEHIRARSDERSTIESGWPDFTILLPNRPALMIEFKSAKGKESPAQVAVRSRLEARGHRCYVCRGFDAAIALVDAWRAGSDDDGRRATGCVIRRRGPDGDWLHDGAKWLRKATIADHAFYKREEIFK